MESGESIDIITEVLEVFINHILYIRDVYPQQIFHQRKVYNTAVYISIFPQLNTYIYNILLSSRMLLQGGDLQCLELVLFSSNHNFVEKYVFNLNKCSETASCSKSSKDDTFLLHFEQQLRTSLLKLAERIQTLEKLPTDVKVKIMLYTTQSGFLSLSHDPQYQSFPWLQEDVKIENLNGNRDISILPVAEMDKIGLEITAKVNKIEESNLVHN